MTVCRSYGIPRMVGFDIFVEWLWNCTMLPPRGGGGPDATPLFRMPSTLRGRSWSGCEGAHDPHWTTQQCWCGHPALLRSYDFIGDMQAFPCVHHSQTAQNTGSDRTRWLQSPSPLTAVTDAQRGRAASAGSLYNPIDVDIGVRAAPFLITFQYNY